MAEVTDNDRKVMEWIDRMRAKHGPVARERIVSVAPQSAGTVYEVEYDWGEALARAFWGEAWHDIVRYADPHATDEVVALAEAWEAGRWPDWCERSGSAGASA